MTILYYLVYSTLMASAFLASPFLSKVRKGIFGRLGLLRRLKQQCDWNNTIWIHVASAGEIEQAIPIFEHLGKQRKTFKRLLTYYSPSALKAVHSEMSRRQNAQLPLPWDAADYAPFDLPFFIRPFLRVVKPRVFIAINREIWPGILSCCAQEKIPAMLLSTFIPRQRQQSFKRLKIWASLFSFIGTVDKDTSHFLKDLLPNIPIEQKGDSRIERVLSRQKMQSPSAPWRTFFQEERRTFVAASIWPEDFEALKPSLISLSNHGWRILLVPHEENSVLRENIRTFAEQAQLPIRYWSEWVREPDSTSSLVVDAVGFLAELYQIASLVFIGGSFRKRIHNILEPMAYGIPVIMGPHIWNSAQACEWQGEGCTSVPNSEEMSRLIENYISTPEMLKANGLVAKNHIVREAQAGQKYAEVVLTFLPH